jgi:hypothetical protein
LRLFFLCRLSISFFLLSIYFLIPSSISRPSAAAAVSLALSFSALAKAEQAHLGDQIHALQSRQCELQNERDAAAERAARTRLECDAQVGGWGMDVGVCLLVC